MCVLIVYDLVVLLVVGKECLGCVCVCVCVCFCLYVYCICILVLCCVCCVYRISIKS